MTLQGLSAVPASAADATIMSLPKEQQLKLSAGRFAVGESQKRTCAFLASQWQHSAPEVTTEHRGLLVQHPPWSGQQKEAVAKSFVMDQIPP